MNISKLTRVLLSAAAAAVLAVLCNATIDWAAPANTSDSAAKDKTPALVDLNTATRAELENVPGIGSAYAKKIISHRPYASVSDLSKAGIPAANLAKIMPLVAVKVKKPVDLNTATLTELEEVPGVGSAYAKRIIAHRPYSTVSDLSKAGISAGSLAKIMPLVTVKVEKPVDLNTATLAELEKVPGVGSAYAKRIIARRPYATVNDLSKSGIPAARLEKIVPLVTVKAKKPPLGPRRTWPPRRRRQAIPPGRRTPTRRRCPRPAAARAAPRRPTRPRPRRRRKAWCGSTRNRRSTTSRAIAGTARPSTANG